MSDPSQNDTDSSTPKSKLPWLKDFQFKPGQSGNPGGRRKNPFTGMYAELMDDPEVYEAVKEATRRILTQNKSYMATVLQQEKMAERLEGKVAQTTNLNVNLSLAESIQKAKERIAQLRKKT